MGKENQLVHRVACVRKSRVEIVLADFLNPTALYRKIRRLAYRSFSARYGSDATLPDTSGVVVEESSVTGASPLDHNTTCQV